MIISGGGATTLGAAARPSGSPTGECVEVERDGVSSHVEGDAAGGLGEIGIHVHANRLTSVCKNMNLGVVALVFRCTAVGGTPHTTDESCEVQWLDFADAVAPTHVLRAC